MSQLHAEVGLQHEPEANPFKIAEEVKRAVKSLDSPIRWEIVETLREKQELSYAQLMERLGIKKGQLTYHLNELLKGAILENYSKESLETKYDYFYAISS